MIAYIEHIREIVEAEPNDMVMGGMIRKYFNMVEKHNEPKPVKCVLCSKEMDINQKSPIYVQPTHIDCAIKSRESEKIADKFRKKYKKDHAYCPKCKGENYRTTLAGYILDVNNLEAYKDLNECSCTSCGDVHTFHERVGI